MIELEKKKGPCSECANAEETSTTSKLLGECCVNDKSVRLICIYDGKKVTSQEKCHLPDVPFVSPRDLF